MFTPCPHAHNTLQHTASDLMPWRHMSIQIPFFHTATHNKTLQHTATHRNTLQHTATHCHTLQHSWCLKDIRISLWYDDCFYYHLWRNNVVIAFGTLSSFLTQLHIVRKKDKLFADHVTQVCKAHNRVIVSFLQQVQGVMRLTTEGSRENIGHNVHVWWDRERNTRL